MLQKGLIKSSIRPSTVRLDLVYAYLDLNKVRKAATSIVYSTSNVCFESMSVAPTSSVVAALHSVVSLTFAYLAWCASEQIVPLGTLCLKRLLQILIDLGFSDSERLDSFDYSESRLFDDLARQLDESPYYLLLAANLAMITFAMPPTSYHCLSCACGAVSQS